MTSRIWHQAYEANVPNDIDFRDLTVPDLLAHAVTRWRDRPALVFGNRTLTYGRLQTDVDRFATALARLGVGRDTRVAIQLPNLPQAVIAFHATLRLGAQAVMTNPLYVERELTHQWGDAGCSVAVVADFIYATRIAPIRDKLPVEHYVIASIPEYLRFPTNLLARFKLRRSNPPLAAAVAGGPGIHRMGRLIRSTPPAPPSATPAFEDVAIIQYTGGTTGPAKGAMLTHRNLSSNIQQIRPWFTNVAEGREVFLACLPFFHVYGLTIAMNLPVMIGAAAILVPNPRDIRGLVRTLERHRVTVLPAVPTLFNAINNYPGIQDADLTSIKACFSAAASLPVDVLQRFEELTGARIVEGFGMTETSPVTHANPLMQGRRPGSIGVPIPSTDARIVDGATGTPVDPEVEGELVVRGPQVMQGYLNRPDATAETIKDGWLYTGDIARMDRDGFFYIVGRKKELIIASGYNVYPDEVDGVLMAHPAVLEAATIGLPHPKRGETVKSFVVLKPGQETTAAELIEYCRENLAAYKIPRNIEFRDQLPKSGALKVLRRELRAEAIAAMESTHAASEGS